MSGALDWISQFFETLALFVPRRVIVAAPEQGVKWRYGCHVMALGPGIHWYWPFVSRVEVMATARQTMELEDQTLFTSDRHQVVVSAVVTYAIADIVLAIGAKNYDIEDTLADTSRAAVVDVVSKMTLAELQQGIDDEVVLALTKCARRQLRKYGVSVRRVALTNFAACRVYKLLGINS